MADQVTFNIIRHCGVISTDRNGWTKEIIVVSWNGGDPKYDCRSWNKAHDRMTRGLTFTDEEASKVREILTTNM